MLVLKLLLVFSLLHNPIIHGYPADKSLTKEDVDNKEVVYLNLTLYHQEPEGRVTLVWEILPESDPEFLKFQRELEDKRFQDVARQVPLSSGETTTAAPGNFSTFIETFISGVRSVPSAVGTTAWNLIDEVRELAFSHVNFTEVRRKPITSGIQAINNVAFCNPIFAGVNPGRCKGYLVST